MASRKKSPKRGSIGKVSRPLREAKKQIRKPRKASRKQYTEAKKTLSAYKKQAKVLGKLAPDIAKLAKKTKLTAADKAKIKRRANALRGVDYLIPITGKNTRKFSDLFFPGTNAIRFKNTSSHATAKPYGDDLIVVSNGRTWLLWRLNQSIVRNKNDKLADASAKAYAAKFPIEKVADLANKAFTELNVEAVSLWTHAGRSDTTFSDLKAFLNWMREHWQAGKYIRTDKDGVIVDETDPARWINGLAIWLKEPKKLKAKSAPKAPSGRLVKTGRKRRLTMKEYLAMG